MSKIKEMYSHYQKLFLSLYKNKDTKWIMWILTIALLLRLIGLSYGLPFYYVGHEWELASGPFRGIERGDFFSGYLRQGNLFFNILMIQVAPLSLIFGKNFELYHILARFNSAIFSTATILLTFHISKRLFKSQNIALLSSALMSVIHLNVIWGHYARIDTPAAFFSTLVILLCIRSIDGKDKNYYMAGFFGGLAASAKFPNAVFVGLILLITALVRMRLKKNEFFIEFKKSILAATLVPIGFIVGMPYSVIKFNEFISTMMAESEMARMKLAWYPKVYSTLEGFVKFFIEDRFTMRASHSLIQAIGLVFFVVAVIGIIKLLKLNSKRLISFLPPVIFFIYVLMQGKPNTRWFLPILPILSISCAFIVMSIYERGYKKLFTFVLILVFAENIFWSSRFLISSHFTDKRTIALEWMNKRLSSNEKVAYIGPNEFYPPHYALKMKRYRIVSKTRNKDNAIANDRAPSLEELKDLGVDYFMVSSKIESMYKFDEFKEVFPETAESFNRLFNEVRDNSKIILNTKGRNFLRPGPNIEVYKLK